MSSTASPIYDDPSGMCRMGIRNKQELSLAFNPGKARLSIP